MTLNKNTIRFFERAIYNSLGFTPTKVQEAIINGTIGIKVRHREGTTTGLLIHAIAISLLGCTPTLYARNNMSKAFLQNELHKIINKVGINTYLHIKIDIAPGKEFLTTPSRIIYPIVVEDNLWN